MHDSEIDSEFTDDELQEYLRRTEINLDGIWSTLSKTISTALGSARFDLNRWWCLTRPDWKCPACRRSKQEIARLNSHGEVMGHLVAHHDHMDRYVERRLNDHIAAMKEFHATWDSKRFAERAAPAIAAFDPAIICEDCNNSDSAAKKLVGAHIDFSFTPSDISRFVVARPRKPHAIDEGTLSQVWAFRSEQLQRRFELVEAIVKLASTNSHWYEDADFQQQPNWVEQRAKGTLFLISKQGPLIDIDRFEAISAPKPIRSPDKTRWRTNGPRKKAIPPTDQEIEWVKVSVLKWKGVADGWNCPWCRRSKVEIIRPSKQSKWSFSTHHSTDYDEATGKRHPIAICQDCQDIRQRLADEAELQVQNVRMNEVTSIIEPQPHARHLLKSPTEINAAIQRVLAYYWDSSI